MGNKNSNKIAIVVEGGGFKCIFTAGVLDAFIINRFDPFEIYVGVSGGAMNLTSFISGQYKRSYKIITSVAKQASFINLIRYFKGKDVLDLDVLVEIATKKIPLNKRKIDRVLNKRTFIAIATDIYSGNAVKLKPKTDGWFISLKASSSLPVITHPIKINDQKLIDGGFSEPIPVKTAIEEGAERVIIIRTHPKDQYEDWNLESLYLPIFYKDYPELQKILKDNAKIYRENLDLIKDLSKTKQIFQIVPNDELECKTVYHTKEKLRSDYLSGLEKGMDFLFQHRAEIETEKADKNQLFNLY